MQKENNQLQAARKVYEAYWDSYMQGDAKAFAATLDDTFEMIGTSETEICHTKPDGIRFMDAHNQEVAGKVEMRNRQIDFAPVEALMLVNEQCDIYVRIDQSWNFYSKLRISTLLRKNDEGWKVVQQHGSLPDMRVKEGETMAIEKIGKENLELREAVKRKTAELENKNRELEIEEALEKVRAAAMGMKQPDDMLDVCRIISDQLQLFGVEHIRNVQTAIIDEHIGQYLCYQYFSPYGKTAIENTEYLKSPVEHEMVRQMLASRDGHFIGSLNHKGLDEFRSHRKSENQYPDPLLDEASEVSYCFLSIGEGGLGLSLYQAMDNNVLNLFKRFHQVFYLAYQRFRDIQKAEAQAREAQIEAALERVRSRTMGMHRSDELQEAAVLLFQQVVALGVPAFGTGFNIWDDDRKYATAWMGGDDRLQPPFKTSSSEDIFLRIYKAAQKGDALFVEEQEGEALKTHYEYMNSIPVFKEIADKMAEEGQSFPTFQIMHCAFFSHGYLMFISFEPVLDAYDIFKRFAKVFEQTYTRFLDLQKAESQAREAKIEAALEKVRARTMGMQNSIELKEAAALLFQQVQALGVPAFSCGYNIWEKGDKECTAWMTSVDGQGIDPAFKIPLTDDPNFIRFYDSKQKGEDFYVHEMREERMQKHYAYLRKTIPVFDETFAKIEQAGFSLPETQIHHLVNFSYGNLMFITLEPCTESHDIFKRFGKVFEQTYTRFLDLQKAEAQAREAQIQLALERVRARTMAMQSSDELAEVSYLLNKQVVELGIPTRGCAFNIYNEHDSTEWFSSLEDTIPAYKTPRENIFLKYYEAGQRGETLLIEEFGGERIKEHYRYLATLSVSGKKDETIHEDVSVVPEYQIDHVAYFKYGYLLFITLGSALLAHEVFKRFAKEFEQTYTRFLDLKKAEAQAREAQIEAALERVRSRTMAMHRSDELKEAAVLMFQQVVALGVPAFGTGFNIWDDDRKFATAWMGGQDRMQPPFKTSSSEDIFLRIYEAAQKGDVLFVEEQGGEALKTHYEYMNSIPVFKEIADKMAEAGQSFPTFQIMHCAFFSHGYLMFISFEPVPDAYDIFKRFSKVFEQTYTRFLDLQKVEAQAREAQIEAALERVRSKAMSMHNSEDLNATIAAFYRELEQFSITPRRCGVGLLQKNRVAQLSTMNTMEHGNSIEIIGILKMEGHWVLDGVYDNWILQKEFHPVLRGNEIREYNQLLRPQVAFPEYPNDSAQFGYFFFFPEGGVYAWTEKEMKEDELNIYRRFTRVLSLTYKRYKDLKDAEANALEAVRRASLDRVRAEIASMRTVDDLKRITPIIWHELTALGVPFVRCGVFIIDEATEHIQVHLSSPDGSALGALDLPFNSSELTLNSVNHWRQGIIFKTHWNKQEFMNFMQSMIKLGQISNPETYQGATQPPESLHLHFVPFKQGMLYAGNTSPLEKEALELVKSLAESFSIAFARYEDFKQLQIAKNQIEKTFTELKATQAQLIQSEKMASLGELTAGIAHEIQNPLNFVNNFSELSKELISEMNEELAVGNHQLVNEIAEDIRQNLEKINYHGKRAADIVKGMLQHSRTSSGQREPTDVNALANEFLRLAYHGLRAKDKSFNAKMTTDFDETIGKINIIPQDIGRVILNLITNAFYAVGEKKKQLKDGFEPVVSVSTKKLGNRISISVKDNGPGIPVELKDKIFQPFFTTKPTGQGTGLGLSLSYDIVKAHGGELKVETKENYGTEFIIQLPTT